MSSDKASVKSNRVKCTFCDQERIHNAEITEAGTNIGNGGNLGQAIMEKKYGGLPIREHPLSMPMGHGCCAQAHHLICSEAMDSRDWSRICKNFGYNINCVENGIILPADMRVACQEAIPLHRGNHSETLTTIEDLNYVDAVKSLIEDIKNSKEAFCKNPKKIIPELNKISKDIWKNLKNFNWTITSDGIDYMSVVPHGCLNQKSLTRKKEVRDGVFYCKLGRKHKILIRKNSYFKEK